MNLFFDLPKEIQTQIYEYEGFYREGFSKIISELKSNYFCYERLFLRISQKLPFYRWMSYYYLKTSFYKCPAAYP